MKGVVRQVLTLLVREYFPPVDAAYLASRLAVDGDSARAALEFLVEQGLLKARDEKYRLNPETPVAGGRFQAHSRGYGFIHVAGGLHYYVAPANTLGAKDGDIVWGKVVGGEASKAAQVQIYEILEKSIFPAVGQFQAGRGLGSVRAGGRQLMIPGRAAGGARDGDPVVFMPRGWEAKVLEILPPRDKSLLDVLALAAAKGFAPGFSRGVMAETESLTPDIKAEQKRRLDLRHIPVVTIDNENCRDMDDGFSVERLTGGKYRLGVHIADVAHYVKPNTALDREALNRGFSVYVPGGRIIPMLPDRLTYDLCSLLPGQDRLCLSCLATVTAAGEVEEVQFAETVVQSAGQLSFSQASAVIAGQSTGKTDPVLAAGGELQTILRQRRLRLGGTRIDLPTPAFVLDGEGQPLELTVPAKNIAQEMVEEFMVLANELAAELLADAGLPWISRYNPGFFPGREDEINQFLAHWGYQPLDVNDSRQLQQLLSAIEGRPEEIPVAKKLARCLQKSRYSLTEQGHFMLATPRYTHFSAPLRRYPDLATHRLLKAYLGQQPAPDPHQLHQVAEHCSFRERLVQDAENSAVQLKKVQYMERCQDKNFTGVVTEVTGGGLQVWLPNTVEGNAVAGIPREKLAEYQPGDVVKVRVHRVDYQRNQLIFAIATETMDA